MVNLITDNMDIWTSAQTLKNSVGRGNGSGIQTPYGIKKLRELILELAVRGKLVPQDPKDEPASVLLEKITKEKARLIKEGKIKKDNPLPEITEDEKPFEIPVGWAWARLAEVAEFINGFAFKSSDFSDTGIGVVKIGDIQNGEIIVDAMSFVAENIVAALDDSLRVNKGDMLIAMSGATTGKLGFNRTIETFYLNQRVGKIVPYFMYIEYLYYPLTTKISENLAKSMGSAIPNLSTTQIKNIVFALPPLAEQHRIVAKVDELMALCDRLEQRQTENNVIHQTMVETLLATLTSAKSYKEFAETWQRISNNFDILFTTEQSIDQIKQTILQLAVMGKLVPQDPNDEPASVLLEKITKEKARLIKEGKIKKDNPLPEITEDEKPFELPSGWIWAFIPQVVRNDKYAIKRGPFGSTIKKDFFVSSGYKVYEQQHAINDDFSLGKYYIDELKFQELKSFEVVFRDIIISCSGTVGRVAIAPEWMEPGIINQALLKLSLNQDALINEYFKILFPTFYMHTETLSELQGTAQKNMVSVETLKEEPFPLPPLPEQHRIVAKVDELMALCDKIKARLKDAQTTQIHLADTIVEQAVG